jgi:hypothetical protein
VLGAIKGRSLECLKIAHSANRDTMPKCAMVFAAAHAFLDGMRYLSQHGFAVWGPRQPIDAEGLFALQRAIWPVPEPKWSAHRGIQQRHRERHVSPLRKGTWWAAVVNSQLAAQSTGEEQVFRIAEFSGLCLVG